MRVFIKKLLTTMLFNGKIAGASRRAAENRELLPISLVAASSSLRNLIEISPWTAGS